MKGKLIILTGLPASGKDTLMNRLLEAHPEIKKIITYTDRPVRVGEIHGSDYHFISNDKFKELIYKDFFLEYVKTGFFYKGTSKSSFKPALEGLNIIWRIDVNRAAVVEETFYEKFGQKKADELLSRTVKIMIQSDTYEEAIDRFQKRNPTSRLKEFHSRYVEETKIFEKYRNKFPIVIKNKNNSLDKSFSKLEKLI
jgi:guanylate kinase